MEPHHLDEDAANFFLERAKHDVGLIIPGIAPLRNLIGGQWLYKAKGAFRKLKPYMEEIHKTGAKLFVQLTAGFGRSFALSDLLALPIRNKFVGALMKPILDPSYISASPSELPSRWTEDVTCRALTKKEIEDIIYAYAQTAKMCKEAGVDGVEVHAVHEGYLLDQFTLKYTNHRTDEYGGSFENRYRFPVAVVKAIKAECGEDYPVSLRYSVVSKTKGFCSGAVPGEDYVEVGRDMEESEKAAKYLQDAGYDMFNADNGTYDAWYWAHPPAYMPQNCNLDDVAHIKKFVDIPVVCAGRMEADVAAEAVAEGRIDAMGVARQFLTDGEWVTKLKEDRLEDIQPCICCHNGCFTMSKHKGTGNDAPISDAQHMARCALNPRTMQGHKFDILPAKKPKKIAVIGGGVGGMEVARIATLRGHKVTIYEKADKLGGVFIPAAAPSFKEKDRALIEWYRRQIAKLGIEVKFNAEVKDIDSLGADEVVIATGAKPKKTRHSRHRKERRGDRLSQRRAGGRRRRHRGRRSDGLRDRVRSLPQRQTSRHCRSAERHHHHSGALSCKFFLPQGLFLAQESAGASRTLREKDRGRKSDRRGQRRQDSRDQGGQRDSVCRICSRAACQEERACAHRGRCGKGGQPAHRGLESVGSGGKTLTVRRSRVVRTQNT